MNLSALPLQWRKKPFWLFFESSQKHFKLPPKIEHSAQIFRCNSASLFHQHHLFFSPQLILIGSEIDWIDPISLTEILCKRFSAPLLMFCNSLPKGNQEPMIRRAYQMGVLEVIDERKSSDDIADAIDFAIMVSDNVLTQ